MGGENYIGRKVAILHIGTMKVGTTSVQRFLRANSDKIRDRHGLYWMTNYIRTPAVLATHMQKAGAEGKSIVICDEGLWHFAFSDRADIQGMKDALPGYEFRVIMYVRRPDEFLESWYLQGLKTGTGAPTFSSFIDNIFAREGMDFQGRLPQIEAIFGPVTVRAYECSQLTNGDSVSDFLQFAGIDEDGLVRPAVANVTPDPNVLMMARVMRQKVASADYEIIQKIAQGIGSANKVSILYPQEVREIESRYRGQIEWLQETHGAIGRDAFFDKWITPPASTGHTLRPIYDRIMTPPAAPPKPITKHKAEIKHRGKSTKGRRRRSWSKWLRKVTMWKQLKHGWRHFMPKPRLRDFDHFAAPEIDLNDPIVREHIRLME